MSINLARKHFASRSHFFVFYDPSDGLTKVRNEFTKAIPYNDSDFASAMNYALTNVPVGKIIDFRADAEYEVPLTTPLLINKPLVLRGGGSLGTKLYADMDDYGIKVGTVDFVSQVEFKNFTLDGVTGKASKGILIAENGFLRIIDINMGNVGRCLTLMRCWTSNIHNSYLTTYPRAGNCVVLGEAPTGDVNNFSAKSTTFCGGGSGNGAITSGYPYLPRGGTLHNCLVEGWAQAGYRAHGLFCRNPRVFSVIGGWIEGCNVGINIWASGGCLNAIGVAFVDCLTNWSIASDTEFNTMGLRSWV